VVGEDFATGGFLRKYTANGAALLVSIDSFLLFIGHRRTRRSINSDNVYLLCRSFNQETILSVPLESEMAADEIGSSDLYLAKYSPSGQVEYATFIGGTGADVPAGLGVDATGSAVIADSRSVQGWSR